MSDLYGDLDEKKKKAGTESSKESSLRDWFGRKGAKGSKKGWVDCNAPDGKGGYKSCGRGSGEKRSKYPACRPTPGACKERGRGKSWGKKGKSKKNEELHMDVDLEKIIFEEIVQVLDEVSSEKQRRWACAQKDKPASERPEDLSAAEAEEMCKSEVKEEKGKKDACYHKVKSRYKVWPSAYASGALVKCRKVGAKNWGNSKKESLEIMIEDEITQVLDEKKKKPCKPSKGKRFAKRVNGKCRSFGQKGQAKGGGDRIRPGTKKGDAYCARSAKIKKCKNPPCANDLSRKKWKCRGSKSMKE